MEDRVPVLLVEDSPLIRRSLADLLEEEGRCHVAHIAETEAEAKARFSPGEHRIAIVDLHLREGTGQGVLRFLREHPSRPLTIVLTNLARPEIRAQCMALGADHFFDKSREFDLVRPAIDAFLARTGAARRPG